MVLSRIRASTSILEEGSRLFLIEAEQGSYRLTPYDPAFEKKMAKAEDIIDRYRTTLQFLRSEAADLGRRS